MQRDIEVSPREETDLEMNKGVEFLLRTPPKPTYIITGWRKKMQQTSTQNRGPSDQSDLA